MHYRRSRSDFRRSSGPASPAGAIGGAALGVVVIVAIGMLIQRNRATQVPNPLTGSVAQVASYTLTDDDRTALVQAGRTHSYMNDPTAVGPADRVVAFRRLAQLVEQGRLGVSWPGFGGEMSGAAVTTRSELQRVEAARDDEMSKDYVPVLERLSRLGAAMDLADTAAAQQAHAAWRRALHRFMPQYPPYGPGRR